MALEGLTSAQEALLGGFIGGGIMAAILAFAVIAVIVCIGLYVYWALAWMAIAKRFKYDKPWLAWVPIANFFLIPILAGKKWTWGFLLVIPVVNAVFWILWTWKIYEKVKYPEALSLIYIGIFLPMLGGFISFMALVANMVIIGMIAWGKPMKK